jgi:beta-galactosidase
LFNFAGALVIGDEETNVLAVFVDATNPDSWWYDGGGVYRHVWLEAVNPQVHIADYGVYAPSLVVSDIQPQTDESPAVADAMFLVSVELENSDGKGGASGSVELSLTKLNGDGGELIHQTIEFNSLEANTVTTLEVNFTLTNAQLWSVEFPTLYNLETVVYLDDDDNTEFVTDAINTTLGVRKIYFDSDNGFYLNDVSVKINGCANHQDFAGLGVALPDSLQEFRVKKLQQLGSNAWRTVRSIHIYIYNADCIFVIVYVCSQLLGLYACCVVVSPPCF